MYWMQWSRSAGLFERALLVDDADAASWVRIVIFLMSAMRSCRPAGCRDHRALDRGLRVELGRERDLEEHVLHHVAAVGALELELVALEQHVVEAPALGREHRRVAHLAGLRDERERTARLVASPAAQLLREPVFGAWR
jgi:hypothetical protein